MLITSFIFTAALELAIVFLAYESNQILLSIGFSLLLFESSASIYFEDNQFIKSFRILFKEKGIDSYKIDITTNLARIIIYTLAILNNISYIVAFWIAVTILVFASIYLSRRIDF